MIKLNNYLLWSHLIYLCDDLIEKTFKFWKLFIWKWIFRGILINITEISNYEVWPLLGLQEFDHLSICLTTWRQLPYDEELKFSSFDDYIWCYTYFSLHISIHFLQYEFSDEGHAQVNVGWELSVLISLLLFN